jgi:hypothetical protein
MGKTAKRLEVSRQAIRTAESAMSHGSNLVKAALDRNSRYPGELTRFRTELDQAIQAGDYGRASTIRNILMLIGQL